MAGSGKNEEYNKLFYRRARIIDALSAQRCTADLAGRLNSNGLISHRVYSLAISHGPDVVDVDKLRNVFDAVLGNVDLNPQNYKKFIDVLNEIGGLKDIVSLIEEPLPVKRKPPSQPATGLQRRPVKDPAPISAQEQEPAHTPETEKKKGRGAFCCLLTVSLCVIGAVVVTMWLSPNVPPEKQPGIRGDTEPIWTQQAPSANDLPPKQGHDTEKDVVPGKPAEGFPTSFLSKRPTMKELQLTKWDGKAEKLMLIETIAAHWRKLGTTLGITEQILNGYATKHMKDQEECCREVLHRWLERGSEPKESYPVNWEGLINALEDTGLNTIADDMRQMISKYTKNESVRPARKPITTAPETKHATTTQLSAEDFAIFPEPTLFQLNQILGTEVATRWEEIGEALGVKPGVLDNIRSNTIGSANQQERCLREVFKKWYNGMTSDFSWKTIVEVLHSLDEHRVVEVLHRELKE